MLRKLKLKFILINMSIVVGMLLVIFGLIYQFTATGFESQKDSLLTNLLEVSRRPGGIHEPQQVGLPYVVMNIDRHGNVMASGVTRLDLEDSGVVRSIAMAVYNQNRGEGFLPEYGMYFRTEQDFAGYYIAMVDTSSYEDTLDSLVGSCIGIAIGSIGVFFVISLLLARWAVKPVDTAWKQQKQFISDASHELKTPLTVILSSAELMQTPDCDEENRKKYGENVLTMTRKMRGLVEGLLELSRVDNGQVKKSFEKLSISQMVSEAVLPFEPVYFEHKLELRAEIAPDITLTGSELYLRQVVDILLDNALKYSDPGEVWVRLSRYGRNQCMLSVYNPGTPIAEEEQAYLFERFYRADKARSNTGSFGLGLAIAHGAVTEHGGKIWLQTCETGNMFCVMLPCDPQ